MTELPPRLQTLFERTRKVCFGRFLIEIPAMATVVYGPAEVEAPIYFSEGDAGKIPEHLAKESIKIEEEREYFFKDDIKNFPLYGKIIDGAKSGQKLLFRSKDQINYHIISFIPVGKDLFIQEGAAPPEDETEISTLNRIASLLRVRADDEIPAEPGMCIEGGFVPFDPKYERATIGVRLKDFADVHLSIDVHKNQDYLPKGNSPILLREQAKHFAEADGLGPIFASTKILRQQARRLGSWEGEELALRTPAYKNDKSVHEFRFHSMGAVHDSLHPELDIRLDTGVKDNSKGKVDPSLTDEEALMLWDKLISTIRVRQPSDATPSKTAPSRIPLASQVRTAEPCPQTGWWECTETRKIEGDRRRFLQAGEVVPHALLSDTGMWQKLTGKHSIHQVASVWKLVAYDDELPSQPTAG
jgi:hypothetical protein